MEIRDKSATTDKAINKYIDEMEKLLSQQK